MGTVRVEKHRRFTVMENTVIEDHIISFKALGLMTYLLSKPDHWEANYRQLAMVHSDGEHAVRQGLRELERAGYLERRRERDKDGHFTWVIIVHEVPPCGGSERLDATRGNRGPEDHPVVSTEVVSTDAVSTEHAYACYEPAAGEHVEPEAEAAPPPLEATPPEPAPAPEPEPASEPQALTLLEPPTAPVVAEPPPPTFAEFYELWPRHVDKGAADRAWRKAMKAGVDPAVIVAAARRIAKAVATVRERGTPAEQSECDRFMPYPSSWLKAHGWEDDPLAMSAFQRYVARARGFSPAMSRQEASDTLGERVTAKLDAERAQRAMRDQIRRPHSDTVIDVQTFGGIGQ